MLLLNVYSFTSFIEDKENPNHHIRYDQEIEDTIVQTLAGRTPTLHVAFCSHFAHGTLSITLEYA